MKKSQLALTRYYFFCQCCTGGSGGSVQSGGEGGTALVFFVGGCTYSEIAALRFLTSRVDQGEVNYLKRQLFIDYLENRMYVEYLNHVFDITQKRIKMQQCIPSQDDALQNVGEKVFIFLMNNVTVIIFAIILYCFNIIVCCMNQGMCLMASVFYRRSGVHDSNNKDIKWKFISSVTFGRTCPIVVKHEYGKLY